VRFDNQVTPHELTDAHGMPVGKRSPIGIWIATRFILRAFARSLAENISVFNVILTLILRAAIFYIYEMADICYAIVAQ
jgi:hypothetical protein